MRVFKGNKGITLISLIGYVVITMIVLSLLTILISNFRNNFNDLNVQTSYEIEFDKFNLQILKDLKIKENFAQVEQNVLSFNNGDTYTYSETDKTIYLNNNISIANNVNKCNFVISTDENGKEILKVEINIQGKQRVLDYVVSNKIEQRQQPATVTAGERAKRTSQYTYEGRTAIIPEGFTVSGVASEKTIDGGLVIYQIPEGATVNWSDGTAVATAQQTYDQFVWIPVEETEDMYICHEYNSKGEGNAAIPCSFELAKVQENGETVEKIKCTTHNSFDMAGYLKSNGYSTGRIPSYTPTTGYREPGLVDGTEDGTGNRHDKASSEANGVTTYTNLQTITDILGSTEGYNTPDEFLQTMQEDYNEIATSIEKYGGFYVGRYESSNISATDTGNLVVQAGKMPTNKTDWYTMYAKQKLYKLNNESVGSSMIIEVAYDQVMNFVNGGTRPDSEEYTVSEVGNVAHSSDEGITGVYETGNTNYPSTATVEYNDLVKNIYDLEGNVCAWTLAADEATQRLYRGRNLL